LIGGGGGCCCFRLVVEGESDCLGFRPRLLLVIGLVKSFLVSTNVGSISLRIFFEFELSFSVEMHVGDDAAGEDVITLDISLFK
jgi:hypothetical protein